MRRSSGNIHGPASWRLDPDFCLVSFWRESARNQLIYLHRDYNPVKIYTNVFFARLFVGGTPIYRNIREYLSLWKVSPIRTPLVLRGARQVGKTHSIREFGRDHFANLVEVNLETNPEFLGCFSSPDAKTICAQLEAVANADIRDGETLLFIDEIQESKAALLSLRSFKESRPKLHVIAAGSLLEFALQDKNASPFPVGRVTFAYLQPLSFKEFLGASGEFKLVQMVTAATVETPCAGSVHQRLLELVRIYFSLGGMPEVLEVYAGTRSILEARRVQNRLATGFVADFSKYGRRYDHRKLQQLMNAVPRLVGKKFKYSHVDAETTARDFKLPLLDLERAGLVRLIRASGANGIPLGAEEREGVFKVQYLDIGLVMSALGLDLFSQDIEKSLFINEGSLAEQFVGQELLASLDPERTPQLFYWMREARGSEAEVDFVIDWRSEAIALEVKAGTTGRLRSLRQFMLDKKSRIGVRISQHPLSFIDGVLSVPFYMVSELGRILRA